MAESPRARRQSKFSAAVYIPSRRQCDDRLCELLCGCGQVEFPGKSIVVKLVLFVVLVTKSTADW